MCAGLLYFLFYHPYFKVKEINISGAENISVEEIRETIRGFLEGEKYYFLAQDNIILAPARKIERGLLDKFLRIRSVKVSKKIPRALSVKIKERQRAGIWCKIEKTRTEQPAEEIATSTEDNLLIATSTEEIMAEEASFKREIKECFYLDREGTIYKSSPFVSGSWVVNIYDPSSTAGLGEQVVASETVDFILLINEEIKKVHTAAGQSLGKVEFEIASAEDLRAILPSGCQIYFNPSYSGQYQIRALQMILDEEVKESYPSLEYVDLRIEGRVYYK